MSKDKIKMVYIKLGPTCSSPYVSCSAEHREIKFNPAVLPVLKDLHIELLAFGGGEPLRYWDVLHQIISYVGHDCMYRIVSNGSYLTQEIVDFLNQYNVIFTISDDGIHTPLYPDKPIRWDLVKQLHQSGVMVTFSKENSNIRKSLESLIDIKKEYLTAGPAIWSSFPNFMHCVSKVGALSDKALADSYISQVTDLVNEAIQIYKNNNRHATVFLKRVFLDFVKKKKINGVHCCCSSKIEILADGTICTCPHVYDAVGDIFHLDKIDWDKIKDNYTQEKCKTCDIFDVCGNYCCKDITGNQCYIMRQLNKNIIRLMDENNISYEEFVETLK